MKYYIDTEFLEGTQREKFPISLFRKNTVPTIDLISIGIVAEDGREYYAISKDFNLEEAWNRFDLKLDNPFPQVKHRKIGMSGFFAEESIYRAMPKKVYWIRENVLKPIFNDLIKNYIEEYKRTLNSKNFVGTMINQKFSYANLKWLIKRYGKNNKEIAKEIVSFTEPMHRNYSLEGEKRFTEGSVGLGIKPPDEESIKNYGFKFNYPPTNPEFYAYYADYDWVAFCWIFGKMMDLPKCFTMYCRDLKQILDEKAYNIVKGLCFGETKQQEEKMAINSIPSQVEALKNHPNYPKQYNAHNSLEDARWNKKLHDFLNKL